MEVLIKKCKKNYQKWRFHVRNCEMNQDSFRMKQQEREEGREVFVGESELPRANEGTTVFSLTRLQIIYTDGYKYYTLVETNKIH